MKNIIKTAVAIIALSATALSYAANPQMVSRNETGSLQKIGVVSSGGFNSLDDLDASLAMKGADDGASHYRIMSPAKISCPAWLYCTVSFR